MKRLFLALLICAPFAASAQTAPTALQTLAIVRRVDTTTIRARVLNIGTDGRFRQIIPTRADTLIWTITYRVDEYLCQGGKGWELHLIVTKGDGYTWERVFHRGPEAYRDADGWVQYKERL